jgi:uncharacterized protein with von Willebrand factor type A (vWA) domain
VRDDAPFIDVLVEFTHELRAAGLIVGTGETLTYCAAVAALNPGDLVDVYWAGRSTLVSRRADIAIYTTVFRRYFLDVGAPTKEQQQIKELLNVDQFSTMQVPEVEQPPGNSREEEAQMGLVGSDIAVLKGKSFSACTPDELLLLRRIMAQLKLTPPKRRTRRTVRAASGRSLDMRRMVRESMRLHGEPSQLMWRRRKTRLRPLILILDVSGSMADYSRSLLQFAYSAKRAASTRVEVFCFGTRLTRITRELDHRRVDLALERAADSVNDWDGGTRIGESLDTFVRDWGRRGLCRGGIVVICSDGLDRGDPALLASSMERLSRLCHRVLWLNPHKGNNAHFVPSTLGMMAAAPHIDQILSGHDLASLQELAQLLPVLN